METGKKVTLQVVLDAELTKKLVIDAQNESRKISPHIGHIIKRHIEGLEKEKQDLPLNHVPKKQHKI